MGLPLTTAPEAPLAAAPAPPTAADTLRFVLAPGVQLVGEMRDAAFRERQWLVQRDGRYVQVSEVLYRLLEHLDGERTAADLARAVTDHSDWIVDEATIRVLIDSKLMPLGLIHVAGGAAAIVRPTTASPLRVTMRMKMVPQRFIDPLTAWLQFMFSPAALLAAAIAIGASHWWMYAVHGVRTSMSEVLYTPGALLLTFAIIIVAAIVHELGHASALRYGGGRGRGIGVGLYLIFPAFFTDATDGYRLGRAARVRIDVGGIYFHLLSSVVLIALAWMLDSDLLLFPAFLLNVEALRQFIPFLQLDGYWLLADLTGVPDFFSLMGPFVRSLVKTRRGSGAVLPPLRPVARTAFALYTLAVVPLLIYLTILAAVHLPGFFITTRDALLVQAQLLNSAEPVHTIALVVTQMFFLMLPLLGTVLIVGNAAARALAGIGRMLPPPARRLAGAACVVAAAAAVMVWVSDGTPAATARGLLRPASAGGLALIDSARRSMAATASLEADFEGRLGGDRFTGRLALKRPNMARIEIASDGGLGRLLVNSDGRDVFVYFPADRQYARSPARPDGRNINAFVVDQVRYFFEPGAIAGTPQGGRVSPVGARTLDDTGGEVFTIATPANATFLSLFISHDGVVRRVAGGAAADDLDHAERWVSLKNVRLDANPAPDRFQWQLPADATALSLPVAIPWFDQRKP